MKITLELREKVTLDLRLVTTYHGNRIKIYVVILFGSYARIS